MNRTERLAAEFKEAYLQGWCDAVRRCNDEITIIWGADLVTTRSALDKLLEITSINQNSMPDANP